MNKGLIFDIRRFTLHDGPGIRTTVFFKGCPLRCLWCHNPESQVCNPELTRKTVTLNSQKIETQETTGKWMTVDEVLNIVEKDAVFYNESAGGVTFSGGEPLYQIDFAEDLINSLKRKGYHITVDTSGYAPKTSFERIVKKTDLFLYDIKLIDDDDHKQFTGISNDIILQNLMWLAREGKRIILRFPVIPGITDTKKNIDGLIKLLFKVKEYISEIDLLPYHSMAQQKYMRLNRNNKLEGMRNVTGEQLEILKNEILRTGFTVKIGG